MADEFALRVPGPVPGFTSLTLEPRERWLPRSLLGSVDEHSRARLLELGTIRQYHAGSVLVHEGDDTRHVIVLLNGVVKETGTTTTGNQALLGIRTGGDLVGEESALDEGSRPATVTACGTVVVRVIGQADFLAALRAYTNLAQAVSRSLVAKLRNANARRIEFAGYDAPTRLARVLSEMASMYGDRSGDRVVIKWPVTQAELASLAAVAEPTAQRVLRRLRERGIITTGYRMITITDMRALDDIASR